MRCVEYFYNKEEASGFYLEMAFAGYDVERKIKLIDEDSGEDVWAVFYNPKPLRKGV